MKKMEIQIEGVKLYGGVKVVDSLKFVKANSFHLEYSLMAYTV